MPTKRTENPRVGGSIPPLGTIQIKRLALVLNELKNFGLRRGYVGRRKHC
jgi:hypothetical protein